jgi:predicted nucleic acid-binding Zn ribbon protein
VFAATSVYEAGRRKNMNNIFYVIGVVVVGLVVLSYFGLR